MPTFSPDQIIGKTLIAKKRISVYKIPPVPSKGIKGVVWSNITIEPGNPVGIVYSYVGGNLDPLFWQFITPTQNATQIGGSYYVKHNEGDFDLTSLQDQGVLTTKELLDLKADEDKTWIDKLLETASGGIGFQNIIKYVLYGGAIYFGIKIYKEYKK
jgi:hypothetical protein